MLSGLSLFTFAPSSSKFPTLTRLPLDDCFRCSLSSISPGSYLCLFPVFYLAGFICTEKKQVVSLHLFWPHSQLAYQLKFGNPTKRRRVKPSSIIYHKELVLIHPPSILPISMSLLSRVKYCLLSIIFSSLQSLNKTLSTSSLVLADFKIGNFSCLDKLLAEMMDSKISKRTFSHLCPRV